MTKIIQGQPLSVERLRTALSYDPITGIFTWIYRAAGKIAGSKDKDGYTMINVYYRKYRAGRLAWFYMTGKWPREQVDHVDLDKGNDKWKNLRLATKSQNGANRTTQRNNTSGIKGVTWREDQNRWQASIRFRGKKIHLGVFLNRADAAAAYEEKARELFQEYARP